MSQPPLTTLSYADPALNPSRAGQSLLCLAATFFFPGLGQLLAGRRRRALLWFIAILILNLVFFACLANPNRFSVIILVLPVWLLAQLVMCADAFHSGRTTPRLILRKTPRRILLLLVFIILTLPFPPAPLLTRTLLPYFARPFIIRDTMMSPLLAPGDFVIASRRVEPQRWSVIVMDSMYNLPPAFRRVAALPAETVEIEWGGIYINGQSIPIPPGLGPYRGSSPTGEEYLGGTENPLTLSPGQYFVLADNNNIPGDSRTWTICYPGHDYGLPRDKIIGTITAIYWPPSRMRTIP